MSGNPSSNDPYQFNPPPPPKPGAAPTFAEPSNALKHSGFGITSFCFCLLGGISIMAMIAVTMFAVVNDAEGVVDDDATLAIIGLLLFASMGFFGLSFLFGIVSLFHDNRKKLFGILGLSLTTIAGLGIVGLLILGSL